MPYADEHEQKSYLMLWYGLNTEQHLKNMHNYYVKNRTEILKKRKIYYKKNNKKKWF